MYCFKKVFLSVHLFACFVVVCQSALNTILYLVTIDTAVEDLLGSLPSLCIVEVCKLVDQTASSDDWDFLCSQLVGGSVDEELLLRDTEESSTLALLNRWCNEKLRSEATVQHLIDALKSANRNDAVMVMEQYCKVAVYINVNNLQ